MKYFPINYLIGFISYLVSRKPIVKIVYKLLQHDLFPEVLLLRASATGLPYSGIFSHYPRLCRCIRYDAIDLLLSAAKKALVPERSDQNHIWHSPPGILS